MFRAVVNGSCYTSEGEDKEVAILLKNIAVYGNRTIGISRDDLEESIYQLGLSPYEHDTLIEYFECNYGTPDYDWFVIDCQNIQQCTGKKDINNNFDRIDNDKGYHPNNCRFVKRKDNARNKRSNIKVSYNGEMICLKELSEKTGLSYQRIRTAYHSERLSELLER